MYRAIFMSLFPRLCVDADVRWEMCSQAHKPALSFRVSYSPNTLFSITFTLSGQSFASLSSQHYRFDHLRVATNLIVITYQMPIII
jgi:hypothetical protein